MNEGKKIIFVDYENVQRTGLEGLSYLNKNDEIKIFFSRNSNIIRIDFLSEAQKANVSMDYILVDKTGKNALDFVLIYYLGREIERRKETKEYINYIIISKDLDFQSIIYNINKDKNNYHIYQYERIEKMFQ